MIIIMNEKSWMKIRNKEKKQKSEKKSEMKLKKLTPLAAIILMTLILLVIVRKSEEPLSVETILKYTPENMILAACVLVLFFALKSLTIMFPLSILYLSSGVLFTPFIAVMVSMVGLTTTITIPYWIGRYSGEDIIQYIGTRYPKVQQLTGYQNENAFFVCFITRIAGFLPGDIVSLYFGTCGVKFTTYLTAGISGSLLSIVTTTLLGTKLSNPFSIEFIMVLLLRILVAAGTVVLKHYMNKRTGEK